MLIDHTNGRVLDVLENREKQTVVQWLRAGKESGLLAQLEEVTCDMCEAYANAPKEVFGASVRITIDRFHVMKQFQEQLTQSRRELQRIMRGKTSAQLKGSRWLWLTNPENLTPEQQQDQSIQQDDEQLDAQNRQLFREPIKQRPNRRIQPRHAHHPVACLRHAKLHPFSASSAAFVWMMPYTIISGFRGEPKKPR